MIVVCIIEIIIFKSLNGCTSTHLLSKAKNISGYTNNYYYIIAIDTRMKRYGTRISGKSVPTCNSTCMRITIMLCNNYADFLNHNN